MKRILYLFLLPLLAPTIFAQDFAYVYTPENHNDYTVIRDIFPTSDDHLVVGYDYMDMSTDPASSALYAGIMKTDLDGNVVWAKKLDIASSLAGCSYEVVENADGDYLLWGLSREEVSFNFRSILCKISSDGEMIWSKQYIFEAASTYGVNDFQLMPSGEMQMMISIFDKVIVMKADANGDLIWAKASAIGPPDESGKNPGFEWLAIPDDGGMCASKAENDLSLLRYDEDGNIVWSKRYNMGGYTHGKTIARAPNGNVLIAGFIGYNGHIMEISFEDGEINWVKTFTDFGIAFTGKAHLTVIDEQIILDVGNPSSPGYVIELSEEGEVIRAMQTKFSSTDYNKIEFTDNGQTFYYGSILTGLVTEGMIHRTENVWDETCILEPTEVTLETSVYEAYSEVEFTPYEWDFTEQESIDIALIDQQMRVKYACGVFLSDDMDESDDLLSVYPNPAAENITVSVPETFMNTTYTLTDLSGKIVLSGNVAAPQIEVNLSDLSNGQYILTVQGQHKMITEKITVIK